jgi:hypothetical protein
MAGQLICQTSVWAFSKVGPFDTKVGSLKIGSMLLKLDYVQINQKKNGIFKLV